jgi:large subunit ribosomal protein L35
VPKMKTHSGAKSRFKITGSGKIARRKANTGHFKIKKKASRGRRLEKMDQVSKSDTKRVRRMLGK